MWHQQESNIATHLPVVSVLCGTHGPLRDLHGRSSAWALVLSCDANRKQLGRSKGIQASIHRNIWRRMARLDRGSVHLNECWMSVMGVSALGCRCSGCQCYVGGSDKNDMGTCAGEGV